MSQYGYESAEIIQHLSEYLQTVDLSNVQFVISGYQQFTARELKLIEVLMAQAGSVKVALLLTNNIRMTYLIRGRYFMKRDKPIISFIN